MKKLFTLSAVAAAFACAAFDLPLGGFANDAKGNLAGWQWHDWGGYCPHGAATAEAGELHFRAGAGKDGDAIRSRKFVGRAGDLVTVRLKARGSGAGFFTLYGWTEKNGWTTPLASMPIAFTPGWTEFKFVFTLADSNSAKTGQFELALGVRPGADAWFKDVVISRPVETVETLTMDDFEKPAARPGNPEIVDGHIAPGLLAGTKLGKYRTSSRVDVVPAAKCSLGADGGRDFFRSGARVYEFGRDNSKTGLFVTSFVRDDGKRFDFVVASRPQMRDLICSFTGAEQLAVPRAALPIDFVLSASADGTWELSATSLADSSRREASGVSDVFRGAKELTRTVSLAAKNGDAEVTLDNVFSARGAVSRQSELTYPWTAKPEPTFDPVKAGWPLVFADEFDGREIDTNKWTFSNRSKSDRAALDGNGNLNIVADFAPGTTNLTTAGLWSRPSFTYGYFESRLKFTKQSGWWAAFWICSKSTGNPFLDGFEIDGFEDYYTRVLKPTDGPHKPVIDHNLHVKGANTLKSFNYNSQFDRGFDEFYVLGCKWTPFEITYYLDGKAIASKAVHSPYETVTFDAFRHGCCIMPLHAIVSGQLMGEGYRCHNPAGFKFPENFTVDWVRVYGWPGSAEGAAPTVKMTSSVEGQFAMKPGKMADFAVSVAPAKSGAKIKAVHLFDDGFYLATVTNAPYRFVLPFTDEWFAKTAWSKPGRSGARPNFDGSLHVFCAFAEDENGMVGHSDVVRVMAAQGGESTPFEGKAAKIPGVVKPGRFDEGGPGVAYCDVTPGNNASKTWRPNDWVDGGENCIGSVASGEWLNYTVDVAEAGTYEMTFSYGTPSEFPHWVDVYFDGVHKAKLPLHAHAPEASWTPDTEAKATFDLPAGRHVMKTLFFGQFNVGETKFRKVK